jgi:hypothetical protein
VAPPESFANYPKAALPDHVAKLEIHD